MNLYVYFPLADGQQNFSEKKKKKKRQQGVNFNKFASKLPVGRTSEQSKLRKKLFNDMDGSGNGQLSLAGKTKEAT